MLIKDKIYIDLTKEPEPIPQEILNLLTYKNPDYYQKMNMGLSVWNIPKELKTFSIEGRMFTVMRGEFSKIRPFVKSAVETAHPHFNEVDLEYVNNDFDLDEYQQGAVQAILQKKQGVVHAVTSAGKTLIVLKAICEKKLPALIVVHRKILMQQFIEDIEKYVRHKNGKKIKYGVIGNGKNELGNEITIAIDKSLANKINEYREQFGIVFLDECHLAPAETMRDLINSINSEFRFGVSGTLKRKDQKEFYIFATFGNIIYKITKEQLLAMERVVPVEVRIIDSETQFDYPEAIEVYGVTKAYQLMEKTLMLDPSRKNLILELVKEVSRQGQKTMILSKLVAPCYELQEKLKEKYGIESGVITGKNSKEAIRSYEEMKFKDLKVIFATIGCVSTGVSISDLDNIILISPLYTNELLLHQIRGRLMRKAKGKTKGTLYYIYDPYIFDGRKLRKFLNIMEA